MEATTFLAIEGIRKRFGPTEALGGCGFSVHVGEVHGLVGANGAGKSTLVKVLSGAIQPDEGELRVGDWRGTSLNPRRAQELGIATIYQDPDLVPTLAAPENIALGREHRRARLLLDRAQERSDARQQADRVGLSRRLLSMPVSELSRGEQQLVEIAKALHREARVILMDEPTAPLGQAEIDRLTRLIRDLSADGVAVLYISHRLREVLAVCDRVSVLRDGTMIWTRDASDLPENEIVQAMIGSVVATGGTTTPLAETRDVLLRVQGVGQDAFLREISFELRKGEVVGLAGLVGAGRSRLLKVLAGRIPIDVGEMVLRGRRYQPRSPADAIRDGVGLMSDDRKGEGLFVEMNMAENIGFVRPPARGKVFVLPRDERRIAHRWIERLRIVPPRPAARAGTLSGGNQQKTLFGRWLHADVEVLLIDEPGQGVDVAGKAEIARIVRDAARQGKTVLVSSSETDELFSMVDRILVMRAGSIVAELAGPHFSEEEVVSLASGVR